MRYRFPALGVALALWGSVSAPLLAAPTLTVTPALVRPGQPITIVAIGALLPDRTAGTLCVGVLGPGQNVALGRSPAFRLRIGQIAIAPTGAGQTAAAIPTSLVAGVYQIVIGGCAPQADLAPLATLAATSLTVETANGTVAQQPPTAPLPTSLPHTGAGGTAGPATMRE